MAQPARDSGFTLIEVMVTISLMGVAMAFAIGGWNQWASASAQSGTAKEVQSVMRMAHERALATGRPTCVLFDTGADTYTLYDGACGSGLDANDKVRGPYSTNRSSIHFLDPSFQDIHVVEVTGDPRVPGATFTGRGTGSAGSVQISRDGDNTRYTLSVELLTGRVSIKDGDG